MDQSVVDQTVDFEPVQKKFAFALADAELLFWPHGFPTDESDRLLQQLMAEVPWQQDVIHVYGRTVPLPRLTAWFGDAAYAYSGIHYNPLPWTVALLHIKTIVEALTDCSFNSVLLNLYRNGQDSVGWHSDDEPELGLNPAIASVSFGADRRFCLRHKQDPMQRTEYYLTHGSILLMRGKTQHHWQHQIPKTTKPKLPRVNLTFRQITVKSSV
jgi:alkylated DNA repair dioxygenase AlkB